MCGIIGYTGKRSAVPLLLEGLKHLEYRGYDSAGIACFVPENGVLLRKAQGRISNLQVLLKPEELLLSKANCGIGHTRWATHGKPTTLNAHPHQVGPITLVHNGVIENYLELRQEFQSLGYKIKSETDSELFAILVAQSTKKGHSLLQASRLAFERITGQCSFVLMSENEPGVLIAMRLGSPLVLALDPEGGVLIASDAQALSAISREVYFLEQGEIIQAGPEGFDCFEIKSGKKQGTQFIQLDWPLERLDKQGYPHFMLKEIHEQSTAVAETLNGLLENLSSREFQLASQAGLELLKKADQLVFVACGSSWHAALVGQYWIEQFTRIPVRVELSSEFRYRKAAFSKKACVIGISQSGETADTLACVRAQKNAGIFTLGITNTRGSSLAHEADACLYTFAGPEIGVASSKAFITQLLVLLIIAGALAPEHTLELEQILQEALHLPSLLALELDEKSMTYQSILALTPKLRQARGFFFMGRGTSYPIALEGALKLKEIAYDHAEGYAAGELKHGPIAMIDEGMVVVVLAPRDLWQDKTLSNLEEVKARGAIVLGVGHADDKNLRDLCHHYVALPMECRKTHAALLPFLLTPVVQLLSYHRAVFKGTDVDQPRNLAKSVTVE